MNEYDLVYPVKGVGFDNGSRFKRPVDFIIFMSRTDEAVWIRDALGRRCRCFAQQKRGRAWRIRVFLAA